MHGKERKSISCCVEAAPGKRNGHCMCFVAKLTLRKSLARERNKPTKTGANATRLVDEELDN